MLRIFIMVVVLGLIPSLTNAGNPFAFNSGGCGCGCESGVCTCDTCHCVTCACANPFKARKSSNPFTVITGNPFLVVANPCVEGCPCEKCEECCDCNALGRACGPDCPCVMSSFVWSQDNDGGYYLWKGEKQVGALYTSGNFRPYNAKTGWGSYCEPPIARPAKRAVYQSMVFSQNACGS